MFVKSGVTIGWPLLIGMGNLNLIWGIICGRLFFSFDFLFFVEITSVGRFGGYEKNL
jgi:hypothetical protein